MLKSMGKKKLLTLVAVMAVAVTVMGSFAIWDQLEATADGSAKVRERMVVNATAFNLSEKTPTTLGEAPIYEGTANFTVTNAQDGTELKITETKVYTKADDGTLTEITDGGATASAVEPAAIASGATSSAITVTIADSDSGKKLAGKDLVVKVTGTLQKTTTP